MSFKKVSKSQLCLFLKSCVRLPVHIWTSIKLICDLESFLGGANGVEYIIIFYL